MLNMQDKITLEDTIFDSIETAVSDSAVEDYLDNMPHTRKSVEEMLDAILNWDMWEIYCKLLTEFKDLLTDVEIKQLKNRYAELFDVPLFD